MRLSRFAISGFLLIVLSSIVIGIGQAQSQPVFRIGVIDEERGAISSGARLAVTEINNAGGVTGADGTVFRLELVVQSTNSGSDIASAIQRINQASVIAVLGPATTEDVLNNLGALQNLNVPILTPAIGDTIIAMDSSERIFRTRAAELLHGRALANYLVNDVRVQNVATVQLDLSSTAGVVGFSTAMSALGAPPRASILFESGMTIAELANRVASQNPEIAVVYGPPDNAALLYNALRNGGWDGMFAYNQVDADDFRNAIPLDSAAGILGMTAWPFAALDDASNVFLNNFVRAAGYVPHALEAAGYDSVKMLAEAIGLPGDLKTNLSQLNNVRGVQGMLNPAQLPRGEMSNNVAVIRIGPLGGLEVAARFAGGQRLPDEDGALVFPTTVPAATATPEGVVLTIKSAVQNIRTGPGLEYEVLGQLRKDEQAKIIGATLDFSWVVIQYRGQNGWLARSLLDVFGDLSSVPVITPPPTPTPAPPTATPTPSPLPDILIIAASPSTITVGVPFNVVVTVQNRGTANAGPFAVAATFLPDGVYSGINLPGLGAGQQTTITLSGTLTGTTGNYNVVVVADLNQQVNEGPEGEANNGNFTFNYRLDRPVLNSGTLILNPGGLLSLEGAGTADVQWNATGTSLDFPAPPPGSGMYLIPNVASMNDVYYDLINPSLANTFNLNVALLPNAFIGIITAEGNRGVLHVDSVVAGGPITLTYRVYQP